MKRGIKIGVVFFMVLSLASANLRATTITINLTAEITGIDDVGGLLEGQLNVGDIITGSYIYDSDTPDTDALSLDTIGQYQ